MPNAPRSPLRSPGRALLPALLLLLAGCALAGRGGGGGELRVLVYNIHAGKDAAGVRNLEGVAEVVRRAGADLVLLQEVDRGTTRSGGEDQVATLERLSGLHGVFGRSLHYQGGEYGIAVLSRWPVLADTTHPLRITPPQERAGGSHEPRVALHVVVAGPRGRVHVIDTHLDASRDDVYRLQEAPQVRALAERLRAAGETVLVGGDFNATPESPAIGRVAAGPWRDAWTACGTGPGLSFPADTPVKRIDYLFLPAGVECRGAEVLDTRASDHRPVRFLVSAPAPRGR